MPEKQRPARSGGTPGVRARNASNPGYTQDRGNGAAQHDVPNTGNGGPYTPVLDTYEAESVSTYVALPTLERGGGGSSEGSEEVTPSTWNKFLGWISWLEEAAKGSSKQSWGMIIYGMGDGRDSTASEATDDAKIMGSFDYKEFMEIMGLVMTAIPSGTTPQATLDHFKDIDIRDPQQVAEFCMEIAEEREEIEEVLFPESEWEGTDAVLNEDDYWHGEMPQGTPSDDGLLGSSGNSGQTSGEQGDDKVYVDGEGWVPRGRVVFWYEVAELEPGAEPQEYDGDPRGKSSVRLTPGAVWSRAVLLDGSKRYAMNGQLIADDRHVPHALWAADSGAWGLDGAGGWTPAQSGQQRLGHDKDGKYVWDAKGWKLPWSGLV